jgi:hypothetical protein
MLIGCAPTCAGTASRPSFRLNAVACAGSVMTSPAIKTAGASRQLSTDSMTFVASPPATTSSPAPTLQPWLWPPSSRSGADRVQILEAHVTLVMQARTRAGIEAIVPRCDVIGLSRLLARRPGRAEQSAWLLPRLSIRVRRRRGDNASPTLRRESRFEQQWIVDSVGLSDRVHGFSERARDYSASTRSE